jgi:hypothetical protein
LPSSLSAHPSLSIPDREAFNSASDAFQLHPDIRLLATTESGALGLERARLLVLDEADRMLALGFAE